MVILAFGPAGESAHEAGVRLCEMLLGETLSLSAPVIARAPGRKPFLPAAPAVDFSVSHSGSLVMCALRYPALFGTPGSPPLPMAGAVPFGIYSLPDSGYGPIGADVETERPMNAASLRRITARFFPERADAASDPAVFFDEWTALESRIKASGLGFACPREAWPEGVSLTRRLTVAGVGCHVSFFLAAPTARIPAEKG